MDGATREGNSTVVSFVMQRFVIHLFVWLYGSLCMVVGRQAFAHSSHNHPLANFGLKQAPHALQQHRDIPRFIQTPHYPRNIFRI